MTSVHSNLAGNFQNWAVATLSYNQEQMHRFPVQAFTTRAQRHVISWQNISPGHVLFCY